MYGKALPQTALNFQKIAACEDLDGKPTTELCYKGSRDMAGFIPDRIREGIILVLLFTDFAIALLRRCPTETYSGGLLVATQKRPLAGKGSSQGCARSV